MNPQVGKTITITKELKQELEKFDPKKHDVIMYEVFRWDKGNLITLIRNIKRIVHAKVTVRTTTL